MVDFGWIPASVWLSQVVAYLEKIYRSDGRRPLTAQVTRRAAQYAFLTRSLEDTSQLQAIADTIRTQVQELLTMDEVTPRLATWTDAVSHAFRHTEQQVAAWCQAGKYHLAEQAIGDLEGWIKAQFPSATGLERTALFTAQAQLPSLYLSLYSQAASHAAERGNQASQWWYDLQAGIQFLALLKHQCRYGVKQPLASVEALQAELGKFGLVHTQKMIAQVANFHRAE